MRPTKGREVRQAGAEAAPKNPGKLREINAMGRLTSSSCLLLAMTAFGPLPVLAQEKSNPALELGLEEIIVTAQKFARSVQREPQSVTALTQDLLTNVGAVDMRTASALVPSLHVIDQGPGVGVFIRGVGTTNLSQFADPTVAFNNDGVYMARASGTNGLLFDLARLEVLKGPQGTLYGRNATAGVINAISNAPSDRDEGSAELEIGNYATFRASAMANAVVDDDLQIRIAGQSVRHDGYMTDGYNDTDDIAGRLRVLYTPSDTVSILSTGSYSDHSGYGRGSVRIPYVNPDNPWQGDELPGRVQNTNWLAATEVNVELPFGMLTVLPSWQKVEQFNLAFTSGLTNGIFNYLDSRQTSLETRLSSDPAARLQWQIGAYYFDESIDTIVIQYKGAGATLDGVTDIPDIGTRSYAGFGQATYALTDTLRMTGGLRYSSEDKDMSGAGYLSVNANPSGAPIPFRVNPVAPTRYQIKGKTSFDAWTWRAAVEADVATRSLLYASVSTGFKSGGLNPADQSVTRALAGPATYDPEKLTAYAIGSKNQFFDNRLRLNGEVYYWQYKDQQVAQFGLLSSPAGTFNNNVYVINLGNSDIWGADLDATIALSGNDTLSVGLAYYNSEYGTFVVPAAYGNFGGGNPFPISAPANLTGRELPFGSRWQANISYQHVFRLNDGSSVTASVDSQLRTAFYNNYLLDAKSRQSGYSKTNLNIAYESPSGRLRLGAYVRNIEDVDVMARSAPNPVGIYYGNIEDPRTYGVTVGVKF